MNKLYRSRRDRMFTGLIGGLSENFGVDATLVRLIVALSMFFTAGTTLLIYIVASLVVPKEPYNRDPYISGGHDPRYGGYDYGPGGHYKGRDDHGYGPHHTGQGYGHSDRRRQPEAENRDELDAMMKDIEQKAMKREIEELKKKLEQYENKKGDL